MWAKPVVSPTMTRIPAPRSRPGRQVLDLAVVEHARWSWRRSSTNSSASSPAGAQRGVEGPLDQAVVEQRGLLPGSGCGALSRRPGRGVSYPGAPRTRTARQRQADRRRRRHRGGDALGRGARCWPRPALIALCEEAALAAVADQVPAGQTTVGMRVQVDHLAPTSVGTRSPPRPPSRRSRAAGSRSPSRSTTPAASWPPARSPGSSSRPSASSTRPGSGRRLSRRSRKPDSAAHQPSAPRTAGSGRRRAARPARPPGWPRPCAEGFRKGRSSSPTSTSVGTVTPRRSSRRSIGLSGSVMAGSIAAYMRGRRGQQLAVAELRVAGPVASSRSWAGWPRTRDRRLGLEHRRHPLVAGERRPRARRPRGRRP